jgi:hypothetical protein
MDHLIALQLAEASNFAYTFDETLLVGWDTPTFTKINDDRHEATSYVAVLPRSDKTIVAFQGTITTSTHLEQSILDWLKNFRAVLRPSPGIPGLVHAGFANQLELVWDKIKTALQGRETLPIYVTGHSQGAGVALLATKALQAAGFPVAATYTFAAPRAGDGTFADSFTTPVFRFEHGDDIVPHVPVRLREFDAAFAKSRSFVEKWKAWMWTGDALKKLAKHSRLLEALLETDSDDAGRYRSVGVLCYAGMDHALRVILNADDESELNEERRRHLFLAGDHRFTDHFMQAYLDMLA